ncbi:hypothetical protein ACHAXS_008766 [Conticribra weissflogii]
MEENTQHDDTPKIVTFDVGGKEFKISREFIEKQEGSMLASLVSDTWLKDPSKPIFIDRNYSIFEWVLDYLRYGSVTLPNSIHRDMFLRDLDFYGIVLEEGSVKSTSLASEAVDLKIAITNIDDKKEELEAKRDILLFANYCYRRIFSSSITSGQSHIGISVSHKDEDLKKECSSNFFLNIRGVSGKYKEIFKKALSGLGLKLEKCQDNWSSLDVVVSLS